MLSMQGEVPPMSKLELSKQTRLLMDIFELAWGCWSNIVGCEPFMTVSIHTSHRYSESPPSLGQLETTRRRLENIPSRLQRAPVVQSVENILTNCFSIRVQAATQQSAALTLPADTQVVTRQSRGGQCSATSEQSTNSQRGTSEYWIVRKLTLVNG